MASNADFVQYIADQCSGAGEISINDIAYDYYLNDQNTLIISISVAADGPVYILSRL